MEKGRRKRDNVAIGGPAGGGPADCSHSSSAFSFSPFLLFSHFARILLIGLIKLYQYTLGAILPDSCRFTPTCSDYVVQATRKHGALKGGWLGIKRILRCNPYCKGGHDPVP